MQDSGARVRGSSGTTVRVHVPRTVTLHFQKWPGIDSNSGIEDLWYRFLRDGTQPETRTRAQQAENGVVRISPSSAIRPSLVELVDPSNEDTVWASFTVFLGSGLHDINDSSFAGYRSRLNVLGYNAGDESSNDMDIDLERAILNFQADNNLPIEGVLQRAVFTPVRVVVPGGERTINGYYTPNIQIPSDTKSKLQEIIRQAFDGNDPPLVGPRLWGPSLRSIYRSERFVLVRFERARPQNNLTIVSAYPYPPIDDRGYTGTVHGPAVGVMSGDEIQLSLVREAAENNVPLFAISDDNNKIEVAPPGQLPSSKEILLRLRALSGASGNTIVKIHIGSPSGPVIHELQVFIHLPRDVNVAVHLVKITRATEGATVQVDEDPRDDLPSNDRTMRHEIRNTFRVVNEIWKQAGIRFHLRNFNSNIDDTESHLGYVYKIYKTEDEILDPAHPTDRDRNNLAGCEVQRLFDLVHMPTRVNIYIVKNHPFLLAGGFAGWTAKISDSPEFKGIREGCGGIVVDVSLFNLGSPGAHILAHEFGHFLDLHHHDEGRTIRATSWTLRQLMVNFDSVPIQRQPSSVGPPSWQNSEYGEVTQHLYYPGPLLTIKNLSNSTEDNNGEVWTARRNARILIKSIFRK